MKEWLDTTIDRIRSLSPDRVLEVGCGVGLLTEALAPECTAYHGADLSPIAVARLREFVATKPELRHVELFERAAIDFSGTVPGEFDTVIVNSVAQYFPSLDYLRTVIEEATRVVETGGTIFIGDVRDLDSLWPFHSAVQLAKAPPKASAVWLKRRISLAVEQERELVIAPAFFRDLPHSIPLIAQVEVLPKTGHAVNELTRYRYDVVLHVGATQPIDRTAERYKERRPMRAASRKTANGSVPMVSASAALNDDMATMRRIWSADNRQSIEDIKADAVAEADLVGDMADLKPIVSASGHCGYKRTNIQEAVRPLVPLNGERFPSREPPEGANDTSYGQDVARMATSPMEAAYKERLGLELSELLRQRLPELRCPAAVLVVSDLPPDGSWLPPTVIGAPRSAADPSAILRQAAAD